MFIRSQILSTIAVAMTLAAVGCGKEETYKGKPLSAWLDLIDDKDAGTRLEAVKALGEMRDARAKAALKKVAATAYGEERRVFQSAHANVKRPAVHLIRSAGLSVESQRR